MRSTSSSERLGRATERTGETPCVTAPGGRPTADFYPRQHPMWAASRIVLGADRTDKPSCPAR